MSRHHPADDTKRATRASTGGALYAFLFIPAGWAPLFKTILNRAMYSHGSG
ncbi:hypothetical protein RAA17_16305 [Komagataeibacter rhaeticus]|nr:hypothetical protein [Komagataeibacter rhaeticus]